MDEELPKVITGTPRNVQTMISAGYGHAKLGRHARVSFSDSDQGSCLRGKNSV